MIRRSILVAFLTFAIHPAIYGADARLKLADGFDYPVGPPDAKGYYKARGYWPNGHLGEDWNGVGGGNTDLGDPVYAVADGIVVLSKDIRVGWGNCVIIRHVYRESDGSVRMVDAQYGHLNNRYVTLNQRVKRGQKVGTIGTNRGMYLAHLHFEMRKNLNIGMNRSQFDKTSVNYHDPTKFILAHRRCKTSGRLYSVPTDNFAPYGKKLQTTRIATSNKSTSIPIDKSRQNEINSLVKRARSSDWKPPSSNNNVRVASRGSTTSSAPMDPRLERIVREAQKKKETMERSKQSSPPPKNTPTASNNKSTASSEPPRWQFWKRFRSRYADDAPKTSRTRKRLFRR